MGDEGRMAWPGLGIVEGFRGDLDTFLPSPLAMRL